MAAGRQLVWFPDERTTGDRAAEYPLDCRIQPAISWGFFATIAAPFQITLLEIAALATQVAILYVAMRIRADPAPA